MAKSKAKTQCKPYLEGLNAAQREAVTHGDGPLLVVAGAGTGKTNTIVCRLACLVDRGVPAERILLLTFTRRAAGEMLTRAGHMCEAGTTAKVWGGTFHATANRLLRIYGRPAGISADFTVMDQGDSADMMNLIRSEMGLAKRDRRFPRKETLVKIYSLTVNAGVPLSEVLDKHFPWCSEDIEGIKDIFRGYVERKRQSNVLDYDDLLLFWSALCDTPGVGNTVADRFDHVLVDEYQDTNSIQARILLGMRKSRKNIMVVGDDAQSIYSFRAATVRNILDFPDHFPNARVVTLEQNYRSTQPILDASNAVMDQAAQRYTKNLWSQRRSEQKPVLTTCVDETDQCQVVCGNILDHLEQGTELMHQAVLFRASHHSAALEIELARRNIPFHKYGGLKFVEAAHIKDVVAFIRILENPFDELSWFRVLLLLDGVGPRTARRILSAIRMATESSGEGGAQVSKQEESDEESEAGGATIVSPLWRLLADPPRVPPATREQFTGLRDAFAECQGVTLGDGDKVLPQAAPPPLPTQLEIIRRFYEPIFKRTYENAPARLRDIEQLQQIASTSKSRSRFVTDLTLDPPAATADLAGPPFLEEDFLILSTIHSAKGCEWTVVHIIHAADGMIPSDMSTGDEEGIEEERRLFYVAMTRAKDDLYIYFPLRYYHTRYAMGDGHCYAQLTRYLPGSMHEMFEQRASGDDDPESADGRSTTKRVDDGLSKLWD